VNSAGATAKLDGSVCLGGRDKPGHDELRGKGRATSLRLDRDSVAFSGYAPGIMSLRLAFISKVAAALTGRREVVRS